MDETGVQKLTELVKNIVAHLAVPCEVSVQAPDQDRAAVLVSLQAVQDSKLLIGKNGQNLNALEHVLRAAWARQNPQAATISLDINDYRRARVQELTLAVRQAATRVRDTRRPEALPPMTSYERRIVHTELAAWSELATESVGQDPQRRVVIKPL